MSGGEVTVSEAADDLLAWCELADGLLAWCEPAGYSPLMSHYGAGLSLVHQRGWSLPPVSSHRVSSLLLFPMVKGSLLAASEPGVGRTLGCMSS